MRAHRLISGTGWDEPGCLVVDLPPGTADIQRTVFTLRKRATLALLVVTPQLVAHRDAYRMLGELERSRAVILGGVENMAGQICPNCGGMTVLFPPAPAGETIWARIRKLASAPFSAQAAGDADSGQSVMIIRAVPQQVAAYQLIAREIETALAAAHDNSAG